ncbi:MAG: hypothetical protein LBS16_00225, partial [Prevotellaceae bacterium]|nr:hypothetical protein [Prevotellaceae bacterium]
RTADGGANWDSPGTSLSWSDGAVNTGIKFGDALVLPAAGERESGNGSLNNRGTDSYYWSSTTHTSNVLGHFMSFDSGDQEAFYAIHRACGYSVRCVAE